MIPTHGQAYRPAQFTGYWLLLAVLLAWLNSFKDLGKKISSPEPLRRSDKLPGSTFYNIKPQVLAATFILSNCRYIQTFMATDSATNWFLWMTIPHTCNYYTEEPLCHAFWGNPNAQLQKKNYLIFAVGQPLQFKNKSLFVLRGSLSREVLTNLIMFVSKDHA